jgi:quinolinate synthase
MARYVRESKASKFLIGTESGLLHRLRLENPGKTFYSASNALLCPNMKRTTLSSIVKVMEQRTNVITVPEDVRRRAIAAVDRMVAVA